MYLIRLLIKVYNYTIKYTRHTISIKLAMFEQFSSVEYKAKKRQGFTNLYSNK